MSGGSDLDAFHPCLRVIYLEAGVENVGNRKFGVVIMILLRPGFLIIESWRGGNSSCCTFSQ